MDRDGVLLPRVAFSSAFANVRARTWLTALVAVAVVAYAASLWGWFRPDFIQNWRESDTQTIARHLAEPGSSILYPRVDWGGDGPGYVETEFQLYTWITSRLLLVFGDVEWPGQFVSLASIAATAWLAFTQLWRRYGQVPAALGAAALLASRSVIQCATTIQPEALCLLLFAVAWYALLNYADWGNRRWLAVYAVSGGLAMLVKPTAAQLGIASFVFLLLQARDLLKKKDVWIAWALMVLAFGAHLLHARSIYVEFGNTFGVLSGGDSKMPRLEHLLVPGLLVRAAINSIMWGVGPVGAVAVVTALVLRKNTAPLVALLIANAIWTVFALRYTTKAGGNHYHLMGALLAAQGVAHAVAALSEQRFRLWLNVLAFALIAVAMERSLSIRAWNRNNVWDEPAVAAAKALGTHTKQGDLVVVRSVAFKYDPYWKTISNYEDPRVFAMTRTRGWPVGSEISEPTLLEHAVTRGARFYVEQESRPAMPAFDAWLAQNAHLVATTGYGGKVYALAAPATPAVAGAQVL